MLYILARNLDELQAQELLRTLNTAAASLDGYAVMMAGPRAWLSSGDAWGAARPSGDLMRRLKSRWDPAGVLNRGEFVLDKI